MRGSGTSLSRGDRLESPRDAPRRRDGPARSDGIGPFESALHTTKIEDLAENLPIIVEIVDSEEKITAFLSELAGMIGSGLVTLEKVKVLKYGTIEKK